MDEVKEVCRKKLSSKSVIHANGECVFWTGFVNLQGYGQIRYRDPRNVESRRHRT
jgi:hypothetical protein